MEESKVKFSRDGKNARWNGSNKSSTTVGLGKVPPQSLDLEEAVLGALMLEKDALTTVIDILKPQSFYKDAHQKIFKAILALFDKSEPIDILTVTQQLREDGELEFVGGPYYIMNLTTRIKFHKQVNCD